MDAIYIPQLTKSRERTQVIKFEEFLPELETLTPVRGWISVKHNGNYLEISAKAETIVTLTCHRCLQQYNFRVKITPSELIWLDAAASKQDFGTLEKETPQEDLVETISPQGYFQPREWLYEQMCLAIPYRQLCDANCQGIQPQKQMSEPEIIGDRRWAALEALKGKLPN